MEEEATKPKRLIKKKGGQLCTGIHLYAEFDRASYEARWGTGHYAFRNEILDYFIQIGMCVGAEQGRWESPAWSHLLAVHYRGVSIGVNQLYRWNAKVPAHDEIKHARVSIRLAGEDVSNLEHVAGIITRKFPFLREHDHPFA